jgi:predicted RNA binding protein YcfA (HicA-like mRNA interferase family)
MTKLIEADGWYQVSQRGSHRQYKHPTKKGRVTIPGSRAGSCTLTWSGASCDRPG